MSDLAGEILPEKMAELWAEYVQMRNRIAKTRIDTDASQKRIFRQLLNLSSDNDKRICSIAQSIDFKWRGFFEPKNDYQTDYKKRKFEREKAIEAAMPPEVKAEKEKEADPEERKKRFRDLIRKQAKEGKAYAQNLVRKWDNPETQRQEDVRSQAEIEEELRKKCAEDVTKGNFKPHTGGFAPVGSIVSK